MHLLFGIYYFSTSPEETIAADPATTVLVNQNKTSEVSEASVEVQGPQPPEAGHLNLDAIIRDKNRYSVPMDENWQATLTLEPTIQDSAVKLLKRARVPAGAIVAIDLKTSEVLALAERYDAEHAVAPKLNQSAPKHLGLRRIAPSASVFKIVSAAALLEKGVKSKKEYPYKYAKRRITSRHLTPGKQRESTNLESAIATSNNGYFAALANRKLSQEDLYQTANQFGFNDSVPFAAMVEPSLATVPTDELERARMAAGFWHSQLTPLHGAVIAQTIANQGKFAQPRLVKYLEHQSGVLHKAPQSRPQRVVLPESHALSIERGLRKTITAGTGRRSFADWPKKLGKIKVYGKTGTLGARKPDRTYTWFVGYIKGSNRDIALAVLAINGTKWWRKAPHIARDFLVNHAKQQSVTAGKRL